MAPTPEEYAKLAGYCEQTLIMLHERLDAIIDEAKSLSGEERTVYAYSQLNNIYDTVSSAMFHIITRFPLSIQRRKLYKEI